MTNNDKSQQILDARGKTIPYPLYLTRKALRRLESGQTLTILCDSPESAEYNIPRYAARMGYPIESVRHNDRWEISIKKI